MFFYTIKSFFISGAIFVAAFNIANAHFFEIKYHIQCKSNDINLTFKLNKLLRTVKIVPSNSKMKVEYWAKDSINFSFPTHYSLSGIEYEELSANLNRFTGTISLIGKNASSPLLREFCLNYNDKAFCDSDLLTEYSANCTKVEQKF